MNLGSLVITGIILLLYDVFFNATTKTTITSQVSDADILPLVFSSPELFYE